MTKRIGRVLTTTTTKKMLKKRAGARQQRLMLAVERCWRRHRGTRYRQPRRRCQARDKIADGLRSAGMAPRSSTNGTTTRTRQPRGTTTGNDGEPRGVRFAQDGTTYSMLMRVDSGSSCGCKNPADVIRSTSDCTLMRPPLSARRTEVSTYFGIDDAVSTRVLTNGRTVAAATRVERWRRRRR